MKLSTLLITLGGLLAATTLKWFQVIDRRTLSDIYEEAIAGKLRTTEYVKIIRLFSMLLVLVGTYPALTWR